MKDGSFKIHSNEILVEVKREVDCIKKLNKSSNLRKLDYNNCTLVKEGTFVIYTPRIKRMYERIQNKLFYIIPEKWDKVYLYASVLEQVEGLLTGEMYFYYIPKGILKMRPVNGYEIPSKYNIEEENYAKHLEELYEIIKELWREFAKEGQKVWYSLTISIEDFKFKIEYNYTDIQTQPYSPSQRHVIWSYKNLKRNIETYNKREQRIIEKYLEDNPEEETEIHEEAIYKNQVHNVIQYEKDEFVKQEIEKPIINNEILANKNIN